MFPRRNRLSSASAIVATLRKGSRRSTELVAVSALPNRAAEPRVAVIVSTKVSKRAVQRNLLKRRARAILRTVGLPAATDLVVRIQPAAKASSFAQLSHAITQCATPFKR